MEKKINENVFLSIPCCFLLTILFYFLTNRVLGIFDNKGNLIFVVSLSCFFFLSFFAMYYIFSKIVHLKKYPFKILSIAVTVIFSIWFILMYLLEPRIFYFNRDFSLRHRVFPVFYILILIICSVGAYFLTSRVEFSSKKIRIAFAIFFSVLQSVVLLAPNIINDTSGALYHIHAYFNPIYNLVDFRPYSEIIRSIYGHYPLIYYIPMNILLMVGFSKVISAMIITCIIGFISFLLIYLSLSKYIERDGLYFISLLSIGYLSFYIYLSGQYYQLLPHRIIIPSVLIYYMSVCGMKKLNKSLAVIMLSVFFLWNIETGIVCSIVWLFYYFLCAEKRNIKSYFIRMLKGFMLIIGSFLCSFMFINIFNILIGGKFLTFGDFVFPLGGDTFDIGSLEVKMPGLYSFFYLELFAFLVVICFELIKFFKFGLNDFDRIVSSVTMMGIGLSVYFINRPAFGNIAITHIPFIFIISLFMNKFISADKLLKDSFIRSILICTSAVLSFFALGTVTGIPITFANRINSSWNMANYNEFKNYFIEMVPENTPAIGAGLPDIYYDLGWDPQIYVMDWSDWTCSEDIKEYVFNEIDKCDTLLIDKTSEIEDYIDFEEWIVMFQIDDDFSYLVRVDKVYNDKKSAIIDLGDELELNDYDFISLCYMNNYGCYPSDEYIERIIALNSYGSSYEDMYNLVICHEVE